MHSRLSRSLKDGGHPIPQSPMVPMPDKSATLAFVQRYLNVFLRYAGVGIVGTMIHFLILVLLLDFTTPVVASTAGAIAGCITNYHLAKTYVFTARLNRQLDFPKFVTVAVGGVMLNASAMFALTPFLPVLACQALATGLVLATGFLLNSAWSFCAYTR